MMTKAPLEEIQFLTKFLNDNLKAYQEGNPRITDEVYDTFYRRLVELETKCPNLKQPDSPTYRVGVTPENKVKLPIKMLSLENVFTEEDILRYLNRIKRLQLRPDLFVSLTLAVERKVDGFACCLEYRDGKLIKAYTRGDGVYGEDITENVLEIDSIPHEINYPFNEGIVYILGEIYLPKSAFNRLNAEQTGLGLPSFKHPRNVAVGTIKGKDKSLVKSRGIAFLAYGQKGTDLDSQIDTLMLLREIGFDVPHIPHVFRWVQMDNLGGLAKEVYEYCVNDLKSSTSSMIDYEADGIVIKTDKVVNMNNSCLDNGKYPYTQVAFKIKKSAAISTLLNIREQMSPEGYLTPVAEIEPIEIDGSSISKVSLYNRLFIEDNDIRIGDKLEVIRSGSVIPKIVSNLSLQEENRQPKYQPLEYCPYCQTKLIRTSLKSQCLNTQCQERLIVKLTQQCKILGMKGFGRKNIEKIGVFKLYQLMNLNEKLLNHNSELSEKIATKLYREIIKAKKEVSVSTFLEAMLIPSIGPAKISLILKVYSDPFSLIRIREETSSEMLEIDENSLTLLKSYFGNEETLGEYLKCLHAFGYFSTDFNPKDLDFT